jgi:folylpolyglutamate synthase/dihydropteroate synthase
MSVDTTQDPELSVYPVTHSVGTHSKSSSISYVFFSALSTNSSSVGLHASPSFLEF